MRRQGNSRFSEPSCCIWQAAALGAAQGIMGGAGGGGALGGGGGPATSGIEKGDVAQDLSSRNIVTVAPPESVLGEILKFAAADQPRVNGGLGWNRASALGINYPRGPGVSGVATASPSGGVSPLLLIALVGGGAALFLISKR